MKSKTPLPRWIHPGLTWIALVIVILLCLAMCVPVASGETGVAVPALASLDRDIPALLEKWQVPGAAVAVALDGRIVFVRGYGLADREGNIAVQPDTRFRLAGGTKPITAALTLKLVEDGRLSLDERVFARLGYPDPTYAGAQRDPRLDQITVRQLLNHSGGWNRDTAVPPFPILAGGWEPTYYQSQVGALMRQSPATAETTARFMVGQPLQFAPGTAYSYSNVGYCILGRLLEQAMGRTLDFERLVQQFLATAGISGARLAGSPRALVWSDEAVAYDHPGAPLLSSVFGTGQVARPYYASIRTVDSHAGLAMSALEYLRFLLALDGANGVTPLLRPASLAAMRTVQPPATDYGFGWMTRVGPYGGSGYVDELPGTLFAAVRSEDGRVQWLVLGNSCPGDSSGQLSSGGIRADLFAAMRTAELALRASPAPEHDFAGSTLDWAGWMRQHFSATPAPAAYEDSDRDGASNVAEYSAGLDPNRADAVPGVSFAILPDGTPAITFRRPILEHSFRCRVESIWAHQPQAPDGSTRYWSTDPGLAVRRTTLNSDGTLTVTALLPDSTDTRLQIEVPTSLDAWGYSPSDAGLTLAPVPVARLLNLSTRGRAGQGEAALVVGFVVRGTQPRTFLLRGVGPTLAAFGVPGTLGDPVLRVFASDGRELARNDNWGINATALAGAAGEVGGFQLAADSSDAALLITLRPGAYTAQLGPSTDPNRAVADETSGNALLEIYEADRGASALANLSCRARVGREWGDLLAGFVVAGDRPRSILVRAVGPGLRAFGISDALGAPSLDIMKGETIVAHSTSWSRGTPAEVAALVDAMRRVGAFELASGSSDAAVLVTLAAGDYTLRIIPEAGEAGTVLAEVYDLP